MMLSYILSLGLGGASLQAAPLDWMLGHWCTSIAAGRQTCERWARDPNGGLQGASEVRRDGIARAAETMRVAESDGELVFHAEPRGQAPTDFRAIMVSADAIIFENRAHDYPQRVRYWREGAALMAEISLADGSKPMRWTFHRTGE